MTKDYDELIKRLNTFITCGCSDDDWPPLRHDIATALSSAQAEIAELREAVHRAYVEGHNHGRAEPPVYQSANEDWQQSRSCAALNKQRS